MSLPRFLARTTAAAGVLAVVSLGFAGVASAHVKVSGTDATQGGEGVVTFRVPSESATASTTGLRITFPAATPFTDVDVQPKAGWKAQVVRKPLAKPVTNDDGDTITSYVSEVDYTATTAAAAIPPGDFDMFNLSVGPFPKAPSVSFAALQTYSNGMTVNWDEQSSNGTEPEHPAPVLTLAGGASAAPAAAVTASSDHGSSNPTWPGYVGLAAGIVALLVAAVALVTVRSGRQQA